MRETSWGDQSYCPRCGNPLNGGFCHNCSEANRRDAAAKERARITERNNREAAKQAKLQQAEDAKRKTAQRKADKLAAAKSKSKNPSTSTKSMTGNADTLKIIGAVIFAVGIWQITSRFIFPTLGVFQGEDAAVATVVTLVAGFGVAMISRGLRKWTWVIATLVLAGFALQAYNA